MADEYSNAFFKALARQPVRQIARIALFQAEWILQNWLLDFQLWRKSRFHCPIERIPGLLRPPPHKYLGYQGPWIEDYFLRFWINGRHESQLAYVPVFWTDFYQWSQTHRILPGQFREIQSWTRGFLDEKAIDGRAYFTILEYDHPIWDWHLFPRNMVVFSAGGWGDVPIPLLKGSPPFSFPDKDIAISFVGRLDGASNVNEVRSRMHAALRDHALFTSGPNWRQIMGRSIFSLCPRGLGRSSFRLYEALSVGSIPVYVWDDLEWLPYKDEITWPEFSISINIAQIDELPRMIESLSRDAILRMQERIRDLYDDWFTLDATSRYIARKVSQLASGDELGALMRSRQYPAGISPILPVPEFGLRQ